MFPYVSMDSYKAQLLLTQNKHNTFIIISINTKVFAVDYLCNTSFISQAFQLNSYFLPKSSHFSIHKECKFVLIPDGARHHQNLLVAV